MIDARELRIGNIVNANGVQIAVDFINVDGGFPEKYLINDWYEEDLEPIPLTEEWLIKFGFDSRHKFLFDTEFKGQRLLIHLDRSDAGKNNKWFVKIGSITDFPIATIQYVHQLQNFYFALTGTELTIQP